MYQHIFDEVISDLSHAYEISFEWSIIVNFANKKNQWQKCCRRACKTPICMLKRKSSQHPIVCFVPDFCCLASGGEILFVLGSKWAKFLQDKNAHIQTTHEYTPLAEISFNRRQEEKHCAKCGGKI